MDEKKPARRLSKLAKLRRNRLLERLEGLEAMLQAQREREQPQEDERSNGGVVDGELAAAREATDQARFQSAWGHLHQAFRLLILGMSEEERGAYLIRLRRETGAKILNWRKDAILEILSEEEGTPGSDKIVAAQCILDRHFTNVYFKLELLKLRSHVVAWVMTCLLLCVVAISALFHWGILDKPIAELPLVLFSFPQLIVVLTAGAVGAALSFATSAVGATSRIPQVLGGWREWQLRLPVGGLSAFVVVTIFQTVLKDLISADEHILYGHAIVAGFSDQLLSLAIGSVEKAAQR